MAEMGDNSSDQPSDNAYAPPTGPYPPQGPVGGRSQPSADPAQSGEQQSYTYPPPPPPDQTWPPPPGGVYQSPTATFPTPTNATLILVLGIASIPLAFLCGIVGLLGIVAWVMGNSSLKAIDLGLANPMERGAVSSGRICGMIGTALSALLLVFGVAMYAFTLITRSHG